MADSSVELIEFFRPHKNEVNLYVTNISRRLEKEVVQVKLLEIFSQFGLVYEVQVIDSSDSSEAPEESTVNCSELNYSSLYAFVKFYSARAAKKAKERINGKRLLGGQILKVSFSFPLWQSSHGNNVLYQLLHNFEARPRLFERWIMLSTR
ncbi:RAD52 motif-containing protein 1-like [Orbicella faveolata]|uniref:RAD52 motif-containing protein 1-like n=1 Tax=Orbicella faveolata TaxID=48498 RepID=UPI0009E2CB30|nr:RAD52 motif-containing protein 1-like [Orbicella faveolata]